MKKYIIGFIVLSVIFITNHALASSQTCPTGTYQIDVGVCKAEPTGCPYGDSLPPEKCEPLVQPTIPKQPVTSTPDYTSNPITEEITGK